MNKTICLILTILCIYFIYQSRPVVITKDQIIEYGEDAPLVPVDFIDTDQSKNIQEDKLTLIDLKNKYDVGDHTLTLLYNHSDYKVHLIVQDTTAPQFIDFKESLTLYLEEDVLSHFSATDLSEYTISIQENVSNKAGKQKIHIQAEDIYGNKTVKTCTLTLKEKASSIDSNSSSYTADPIITDSISTVQENSIPILDPPSEPVSTVEPAEPEISQTPPTTCEYSGSIGNSQMTFGSYDEATSWADQYLMENLMTYSGYSAQKIGCPDLWTISFY